MVYNWRWLRGQCRNKYCPCVKYILSTCLIIGLSIYLFDNSYKSLRTDVNTLKKVIEHTQNDFHSVTEKILDLREKMMHEMKKMADIVVEDINLAKSIKKRDDKLTDYIRNIVKQELEQYNADKTGKRESYMKADPGNPLCQSTNNPITQPGVMPGKYWTIIGATGSAVIQLIDKIYVTGVSVKHIHRSISPTREISTALKGFSIWGLQSEEDTDGFFFGQFNYDVEGLVLQYFPVQHESTRMFNKIEFRVVSNPGYAEYTYMYRFRVHGDVKL